MVRILICDDEQIEMLNNKDKLGLLLSKLGVESRIQCYSSTIDISAEVIKGTDVAILDIDFSNEGATGIELAKKMQSINKWIAIIFLTGHSEYVLDAFRLQVFGYLEKPVNDLHLELIMKKVLVYQKGINFAAQTYEFFYERKKVTIRQNNIIYIEKINRKIRIATRQFDYEINGTINEVESNLMDDTFLKINSGTLVNLHYVSKIVDYNMYITDELHFRIARNRLNEVKERYFLFTNSMK